MATKFRRRSHHESGIALVMVLSVLALITVLIVAFFITVSGQNNRTQAYVRNNATQQLSDIAVRLVMSQIHQATSNGVTVAWASQPGMIRTYSSSGTPLSNYKLYSSDQMQISGTSSWQATGTGTYCSDLPTDASWPANDPALYTDLNAPVYQTVNGTTTAHYPIFDPTLIGTIKGLSIDGTIAANSQASTAMPVKWLYILQDGTVVAPDATSTTVATFSGSVTPSSSNPIVGRVAFWTDDDTCKVDINTAAGVDWNTATSGTTTTLSNGITTTTVSGTATGYWTKPLVDTNFDRLLAIDQPVAGEYQRCPGHPANVLLSAVFPTLTASQIYALVPRVSAGTYDSNLGTAPITSSSTSTTVDQDRLYATVDDLLFGPSRTANTGLSAAQIEQSRFCLTTRSVAPEVNLFNLPRVSMWPVWASSSGKSRTTTDNLFALAATLGGSFPYYFQRSNALSQTADLPSSATTSDIGRNRGLLTYLSTLTGTTISGGIPGFGGNFATKYSSTDGSNSASSKITGKEIDQILTECVDYIRLTNIFDPFAFSLTGTTNVYAPYGQVMPLYDSASGTQGFGRWPVLNEAGLALIGVADHFNKSPDPRDTTMQVVPSATIPYIKGPPAVPSIAVRAGFVVNFFIPAEGPPPVNPLNSSTAPGTNSQTIYNLQVTGLDALYWRDNTTPVWTSMGFPHVITTTGATFSYVSGPGRAGGISFLEFNNSLTTPSALVVKENTGAGIPNSIVVGKGVNYPISVTLLPATPSTTGSITTTFNFPSGTFPVPQLAPLVGWTSTTGTTTTSGTANFGTFAARNGIAIAPFDDQRDVVETVTDNVPNANYDHRILAARRYVTANDNLFGPSPGYGTVNNIATINGSSTSVGTLYLNNNTGNAAVATTSNGSVMMANSICSGEFLTRSTAFGCYVNGITTMGAGGYFLAFPDNSPSASSNAPSATTVPVAGGGVDSTSGQWCYFTQGTSTGILSDGTSGYNRGSVTEKNITQYSMLHQIAPGSYAYLTTGTGTTTQTTTLGDWDNGDGSDPDGPYINKSDEGSTYDNTGYSRTMPYFFNLGTNTLPYTATFFIPNKQVPSSMMFGSLSTGVVAKHPWQTLLFRPGPAGHPGLGTSVTGPGDTGPPYSTPPDHLLADLFYMPVVQPYAISEPLATAGKVNMNYQIVPFTYITRSTAIQAVLASEQMLAIPNTQAQFYKLCGSSKRAATYRYGINLGETLKGFANRFNNGNGGNGDIFRSATEICNLWLIPNDGSATYASFTSSGGADNWWKSYQLTGDNARERPYVDIYSHLTTKSNTYTVHYRVQALKKVTTTGSNPAQWNEGSDVILGELRGSASIERYVDSNDPNLSSSTYDFVSNITGSLTPLDNFYKFRILNTRRFSVSGQ